MQKFQFCRICIYAYSMQFPKYPTRILVKYTGKWGKIDTDSNTSRIFMESTKFYA